MGRRPGWDPRGREVGASTPGPCSQTASDGHRGFSWGALTEPPPSCWSFWGPLPGSRAVGVCPGCRNQGPDGCKTRSSLSHGLEATRGGQVSAGPSPSGVTGADSVPGPAPASGGCRRSLVLLALETRHPNLSLIFTYRSPWVCSSGSEFSRFYKRISHSGRRPLTLMTSF